jgi:hypothetical protein
LSILLVNTTPGDYPQPLVPGGPLSFGLRCDAQAVDFTSIQARLGYSNLAHVGGTLPEGNSKLPHVAYESPERWKPVMYELERAILGNTISIGSGSDPTKAQRGVYEVAVPVAGMASVMASVTLQVSSAWSKGLHFWNSMDQLVPVYLGLEYGPLNTGLFVALRDDGAGGSVVAGGPLQAFSQARGGQVELPGVGWGAATQITVFLLFDLEKLQASVWTQTNSQAAPTKHPPISTQSLGTFKKLSTGFSQWRDGPSQTLRLFFGSDSFPLDSVVITDFAIYPDFRQAVVGGLAGVDHGVSVSPESPHTYRADLGVLPSDPRLPSRWRPADATEPLGEKFYFQPGRPSSPLYVALTKGMVAKQVALQRMEPRLLGTASGFSVEAWMGGLLNAPAITDVGMGFYVEDGVHRYQVVMLDNQVVRTFGILKDAGAPLDIDAGYWTPRDLGGNIIDYDYRGLRYVRLAMDRGRNRLELFLDDVDVPVLSIDTATNVLPPSNPNSGTVTVGHVDYTAMSGEFRLGLLNYLADFQSWEAGGGAPTALGWGYDLHAGTVVPGAPFIVKKTQADSLSHFTKVWKAHPFSAKRGFQVDFRARVADYQDNAGNLNVPNIWTGAGVSVFLGNLDTLANNFCRVHVGFFDCGVFGRKIGIIPGNGTVEDILRQTPLGASHSADAAWGEMATYRLVYVPFSRMEVWSSNYLQRPIITVPWDPEIVGFHLEEDVPETTPSVAFGFFNQDALGSSEWEYVRFGSSYGYDVQLTQAPSEDMSTIFDGRSFLHLSAGEIAL